MGLAPYAAMCVLYVTASSRGLGFAGLSRLALVETSMCEQTQTESKAGEIKKRII